MNSTVAWNSDAWSEDAIKLLAKWQKQGYALLGRETPDWGSLTTQTLDQMAANFSIEPGSPKYQEMRDRLFLELQGCPTPYENPSWYGLIKLLFKDLEHVVTEKQVSIPYPALRVGSVPSGLVNALTAHIVRTDEYLIVFSSGLFLLFNLMAKLAAKCLIAAVEATPAGQPLDLDAIPYILNSSQFHQEFRDMLYAHVILGNAGTAPQKLVEENIADLASSLRKYMELFVVGHEFGHIVAGHLNRDRHGSNITTYNDEVQTNLFRPEWEQEFEADDFAVELLLEAVRQEEGNTVTALCAVHLVFISLELIEKLINLFMAPHDSTAAAFDMLSGIPNLHFGERPLDTHPAPFTRRVRQRSRVEKLFPQENEGGANEMGEDLNAMTDYLWHASRPHWVSLREQGTTPCTLWDPRIAAIKTD